MWIKVMIRYNSKDWKFISMEMILNLNIFFVKDLFLSTFVMYQVFILDTQGLAGVMVYQVFILDNLKV